MRTAKRHPWHVVWAATVTACVVCGSILAVPASAAAPTAKAVAWNPNFSAAQVYAKKQQKLILAYFSGSDWDEWGKKLEKEVLGSPAFVQWVTANVIPFRADFPAHKRQDLWKKQNEDLKTKYQVSKVPTFLFIDGDGEIVARATYDDLKLRPEEPVGQPKVAIEFLDNILRNRPETDQVITQPSLVGALEHARSHKIPVLLLLTRTDKGAAEADKLVQNQRFARWVNVNTSFYRMKWPETADKSEEASVFNALVTRYKIGNPDAQLLMWVPDAEDLRSRILTFNAMQIEPLMNRLQKDLPLIEYKGTDWLTDIRLARAILAQQPKRVLFLYFTDNTEFCQKFEQEILKTEEFTGWPYYAFVNVRLDYTKDVQRPKEIEDQNRALADLYAVRGYPYVVVVNPKGQKIGEAKYMKGGPKPFLAELKKVYDKDIERRFLVGQEMDGSRQ